MAKGKLFSSSLLRTVALALGFLPAAFFLFFLIGEGLAELIDGKTGVIPILVLMILTVSGYLLAWKRPRAGGLIMMAGGLAMGIYLFIAGGSDSIVMILAYSLPFIVPGFMLWMLKKS
jgi:hypothetical protein